MHVCVIRPGALGDTLLALPIIQAIRERYENPQITFVGQAAILPLMIASGLITRALDFEDRRWGELFSPNGIQHPESLALLSDCQLVICWIRDIDGSIARNLRAVTSGRIIVAPGRPQSNTEMHIIDYLANTIEVTIDKQFTLQLRDPEQPPTVHKYQGYVAIHPGSGGIHKCWALEGYVEIIQELWKRAIPVLMLAGPADRERLDALHQMLPDPPPMLFASLLNAPLLQVAQALYQCRGYLGNDSGITHLAALLGVPTLALFIASDPRLWQPYGSSIHVLTAQETGLLSSKSVLSTLKSLCV
ncbi:glycosyltransferase family 9 protein [Ktedonospora formicarum]|uniref:Glycosyl transferase n=1 Tax=Ktedonospora formicarum TaxID=2778364 RepID=A0A8J3MSH3_9CHLR|nr:glycosyltransferase family 9 protein [Ktedonospora formicarum]GHO44623.1 glycosyl transferase [Ktedonospora formicarum]